MQQPIRRVETPEEAPAKTLGRRELLKALAAAGGAVTASSLLPGEWAKPVVEVGVLPAHAQVSAVPIPNPLLYGIQCNSDPGGGQLPHAVEESVTIQNIMPRVLLLAGSGSVGNISVTMTVAVADGTPSLPNFDRSFPDTRDSNTSGVVDFGNLMVTGQNEHFDFIFTFTAPDGHFYEVKCGTFELREIIPIPE
jgi:hypothetical protein